MRQHNYADALPELRQASEFAPDNARYAYVYAIALNSIGAGASAMELLENTHKRHPTDRDTLLALVSISRDTGDFATALSHARELVALYPADMQLRVLVLDLRINGVRDRCSTVELSPTRSSQKVTQSAKTGVRLRQVETKHMQLHAHAADYADAFAEIDLRVAGRMDERDEDLARSGAGGPHVILHHRVAAGVAMFDPQPF